MIVHDMRSVDWRSETSGSYLLNISLNQGMKVAIRRARLRRQVAAGWTIFG